MAFQLWLAQVLRDAGLTVVEVAGWKTRGVRLSLSDGTTVPAPYNPEGVIIHETRGSATSEDASEIYVMINGRVGLAGPIAQLYLSRTGTWHVVTAGKSNHVKTATTGPFTGLGNSRLLGIEAQHAESESWAAKPLQYASYVRGVAAILKHTGWPAPVGHKEHQPGDKPDPEFDMNKFRRDVAAAMSGDDDMKLYRVNGQLKVWAYDGAGRRWVPDPATLERVKKATGATVVILASEADLDLIAPMPAAPVQAAPVDPAALKVALLDPEILTAFGAASFAAYKAEIND